MTIGELKRILRRYPRKASIRFYDDNTGLYSDIDIHISCTGPSSGGSECEELIIASRDHNVSTCLNKVN